MTSKENHSLPPFLRESIEGEFDEVAAEEALVVLEQDETGAVPLAPLGGQLQALLDRVGRAPLKYAPFYARVADMLETNEAQVEELLGPDGYRRSPLPGIRYKNAPQKVGEGQVASVVRFDAGVRYPRHSHRYPERLLVLEGGYTDDSGSHFGPGDLHEMSPGTEHGFLIDRDGPCVAVTIADEKLQFSSFWLRSLARLIGR